MNPSRQYDIRPQAILTFQNTDFINNLKNLNVTPSTPFSLGKKIKPAFDIKFVNSNIPVLDKHILVGFHINEKEVDGVKQDVLEFKTMSIDFANNIYEWASVYPNDEEVNELAQYFMKIEDGYVHSEVNHNISTGHMIIYRSGHYSNPNSEGITSRVALHSTNQKVEEFNNSLQNNQNNQSMEEQVKELSKRVEKLEK